jgi:hypothetical protein
MATIVDNARVNAQSAHLLEQRGPSLVNTRWDDAGSAVDSEIKGVLERSAAAWSAGDLDTFMACYEDSPDTIYLTATHIVSGYAAIRSMYAERFGADNGNSMGVLTVKLLRVTRLGSEHVLAVGLYSLEGVEVSQGRHTGMCSLVLHNTAAGWRICADHTS